MAILRRAVTISVKVSEVRSVSAELAIFIAQGLTGSKSVWSFCIQKSYTVWHGYEDLSIANFLAFVYFPLEGP
jgi:hypothetical protein